MLTLSPLCKFLLAISSSLCREFSLASTVVRGSGEGGSGVTSEERSGLFSQGPCHVYSSQSPCGRTALKPTSST